MRASEVVKIFHGPLCMAGTIWDPVPCRAGQPSRRHGQFEQDFSIFYTARPIYLVNKTLFIRPVWEMCGVYEPPAIEGACR